MGISSGDPPQSSSFLSPPSRPCPYAQVAAEVLEELCGKMGIRDPQEVQEFALFLIKGEGEPPAPGRKQGQLDSGRELSLPGPLLWLRVRQFPRGGGRGWRWAAGRAVDLGSRCRRAGAAPVAPGVPQQRGGGSRREPAQLAAQLGDPAALR